jgi:ASPIC and UnbV
VRSIYRDVTSGGSFGASSLRPHIGVGAATTVQRLEIRWPGSGTLQAFAGPIAADAIYEITEGRATLKPVAAPVAGKPRTATR